MGRNNDPLLPRFCEVFADWSDAAIRCAHAGDFADRRFVIRTVQLRGLLGHPRFRRLLELAAAGAGRNPRPEWSALARAALAAAAAPDWEIESLWRAALAAPPAPAAPAGVRRRGPAQGKAGGRDLVVDALLAHHQYEAGSVANWAPAGLNELATKAGVHRGTVSRALTRIFGTDGYRRYSAACRSDRLAAVLMALAEPQRLTRRLSDAAPIADNGQLVRPRRARR